MTVEQAGKSQILLNADQICKYTLMEQADRKELQSFKHDLSMNGTYDSRADPILRKYGK
jgi:hypothetical protein